MLTIEKAKKIANIQYVDEVLLYETQLSDEDWEIQAFPKLIKIMLSKIENKIIEQMKSNFHAKNTSSEQRNYIFHRKEFRFRLKEGVEGCDRTEKINQSVVEKLRACGYQVKEMPLNEGLQTKSWRIAWD